MELKKQKAEVYQEFDYFDFLRSDGTGIREDKIRSLSPQRSIIQHALGTGTPQIEPMDDNGSIPSEKYHDEHSVPVEMDEEEENEDEEMADDIGDEEMMEDEDDQREHLTSQPLKISESVDIVQA